MDAEEGVRKADRIRSLLAQGLSTSEIAETIGCLTAYVRAVKQRAVGVGGKSAADRDYIVRRYGSMKAYYDYNNERTKDYRRVWQRNRSAQRRTA